MAAVLGIFVVGDSRPLWQPNLQATHRLAIAATAFDIRSTAPRIVAITTATAPAMHTAKRHLASHFRTSLHSHPRCRALAAAPAEGDRLPNDVPVDVDERDGLRPTWGDSPSSPTPRSPGGQ